MSLESSDERQMAMDAAGNVKLHILAVASG